MTTPLTIRARLSVPQLAVLVLVSTLLAALVASNSWRLSVAADPEDLALSGYADEPSRFRSATFNLLGHGHTAPGGDRPNWADGRQRMEWAVKLLDRHGISVAGFQEFQTEQHAKFKSLVGDSWEAYPGDQLTKAAMQNSVVWRTDTWELVEANAIPIVYTYGASIRMPFVLLRHLESKRLVWFANFHNASNPKGAADQQPNRDKARKAQIALANDLWESGAPLVLTGDMNEREKYFCQMTRRAPMKAANGGSFGSASTCTPPAGMRIDWIFGSSFVEFSGYRVADGKLVNKTSDHPLIYADVAVPTRPRP